MEGNMSFADGIYTPIGGGVISQRGPEISGGGEVGGSSYWYVGWDATTGFTGNGWSGSLGLGSFNFTSVAGDDAAIIAGLRANSGALGQMVAAWCEANKYSTSCGYTQTI